MARQWGIRIYPSSVLIGADGRVHGTVRGEVDWIGVSAPQLRSPLIKGRGRSISKPSILGPDKTIGEIGGWLILELNIARIEQAGDGLHVWTSPA
jgi:hypothetical protein